MALFTVGAGSFAALESSRSAAQPAAPRHGGPVLVELYQSQGCSSCPPADANVNAIADRPDVVALSFGVTYWDNLGWRDSFAKPQFTERQWDYSRFNHQGNVATPQVWINGNRTIVGNNRAELDGSIREASNDGPTLAIKNGKPFPFMSQFDYSVPLSELGLIGGLAMRCGIPIGWDSAKLEVPGLPEASRFIKRRAYRPGWEYSADKI